MIAAFTSGMLTGGVLMALAARQRILSADAAVATARDDVARLREWATGEHAALWKSWAELAPLILRRGAEEPEIAWACRLQKYGEWAARQTTPGA